MENFESWSQVLNWMLEVWNFQILVIDGKPITVGKVITGLILFILGYFVCRNLSRQLEKRVFTKLDIDYSLRHTLQTISFYIMLIILTLFVLRLLNVPITIFTVLGGALAIGVGFGSQNVVNNFISGLILMIERPIRVGDFIDVGGLFGSVEHIGARSTRIKTTDNTHIVVPNSSFLEKNVLNWTLSDEVVRSHVNVGVAYGSPTRQVEKLLIESALKSEKVLKVPEPSVLFQDFADNSLNFSVFYWMKLRNLLELNQVKSEIRFNIDEVFNQNGIVISFPQRDIHFDKDQPLNVNLLNFKEKN